MFLFLVVCCVVASVLTWVTAFMHQEDTYDIEYSSMAYPAKCTVINYKTIVEDTDVFNAGWGVDISFPDEFSEKRCNRTCAERIPLWCYIGSDYMERATSNTTKYELDTVMMPALEQVCRRNCTINRNLRFRIFALRPLSFFDEWYPKIKPRKALLGGLAQQTWQVSPPIYQSEWKDKIAEKFIDAYDKIMALLERHSATSNTPDEDQTWYEKQKRKFFRILLEIMKKMRYKAMLLAHHTRKLYWKIFHPNEEYKVKPVYMEDNTVKNESLNTLNQEETIEDLGIVYKVVDRVQRDNSTEIDLSGLRLRDLPQSLSKCISLETVILNENNLDSDCFPVLVSLVNLKYCYFRKNKINRLPITNYKSLTKLEVLDLDFNGLSNGFEENTIDRLKLKKLFISNNMMSHLPVPLFDIVTLTALYGNNNKINTLPMEISNLTNLTELSLANNMITEIPAGIQFLRNLKELNLMRNKITRTIPEMRALKALKVMLLGYNFIEEMPNLTEAVEVVNLEHCYIRHIKESNFLACSHIRAIYLNNNHISVIPHFMTKLPPTLELLDTSENHIAIIDAQEILKWMNGRVKDIKLV
eukprot:g14999.t1